jgi:hypothetical protein
MRRGLQLAAGEKRLSGAKIPGEPRMRSTGDHHPDARARAEPVRDRASSSMLTVPESAVPRGIRPGEDAVGAVLVACGRQYQTEPVSALAR